MNKDAVKFELGQLCYSRINPEIVGQVTGICFRHNGVVYLVTWSNDLTERWHTEIEITLEKRISSIS